MCSEILKHIYDISARILLYYNFSSLAVQIAAVKNRKKLENAAIKMYWHL